MKRHDAYFFFSIVAFVFHNQADVFQKPLQVFEILKRFDQFFKVF